MKPILLGYRRKSMVRGRSDLISPERQMQACELWVELHGGEYQIEWYEDVDGHRSGRQEKGRPGWQSLLEQLDRPEVVGVIADSFDRMYRNVHQFLNFLNRIEGLSKRLVTVKEGMDTSSTLGRAIVTILMVIYQLESDQTSDRMAANVKYKRETLGRHWGPTPFGCDRNEAGQLVPTGRTYELNLVTGLSRVSNGHPPEAGWMERRYYEGLRAVYEIYAGGELGYEAVASVANRAGWRYYGRDGEPRRFNQSDVRRMISFWQLFQGKLPLGNITNTNGPILEGGHQPILPPELCEQVGIVRSKRSFHSRNPKPGQPKQFYLLSNILFCGVCGRPLKGQFQDDRRIYRHLGGKGGCPEKWTPAEKIEGVVLERLIDLAQNELFDEIRTEAERLARDIFGQDEKSRGLIAELDRQRNRLTRLEDLYLDAAIEKNRYLERKAKIDEAIAGLEDDLYSATQVVNFGPVIDRMMGLLGQLVDSPVEMKKTLINSLIERLEVGDGEIVGFTARPWARPFF